jgi:hypothetical protein
MRPRLALLAGLATGVARAVRARGVRSRAGGAAPPAAGSTERRSADEVRLRLDETRERLKRETPSPEQES